MQKIVMVRSARAIEMATTHDLVRIDVATRVMCYGLGRDLGLG